VSDGAGMLAECVVTGVGKDFVTLDIRAVHAVPPPQPRLIVGQALPKGDRGELAVELMTEVGVDAVIPWAAERSIAKWQAERGERGLAKWRSTAREAAKQSRRAWLPEVTELATTAALAKRVSAAACAVVLRASGAIEARLGPTVLRTSTAGAAAAVILLSRSGRW
jgi:16S rRNA (uracil1498-N3)-methyltransferase